MKQFLYYDAQFRNIPERQISVSFVSGGSIVVLNTYKEH